jgi:hypothetical protein
MKNKQKSTNHVNIQNHVEKKPIDNILMTIQSDKQQQKILTKEEKAKKKIQWM